MNQPRVVLFADSFHEVNGVANTCKQFARFAGDRSLPLLKVHAGAGTILTKEDSILTLELERGPLSLPIDRDLAFDPLLWRYLERVTETVKQFGADIIHVTGPSDVGLLGVYVAYSLGIPLAASWHTNVHEFGALRLSRVLSNCPRRLKTWLKDLTEKQCFRALARFYRAAGVVMVATPELKDLIVDVIDRPVTVMWRGVDSTLFNPARRYLSDDVLRIGYVGRLVPEKNVLILP